MKSTLLTLMMIIAAGAAKAQDWKPNPKYTKQKPVKDTVNVKIQCSGTKLDGTRCKRTGIPSPLSKGKTRIYLCYQHANQE